MSHANYDSDATVAPDLSAASLAPVCESSEEEEEEEEEDEEEEDGSVPPLRVATANVQTLLPYQEARSYAQNSVDLLRSKVQLLESQFYENGVTLLGSKRAALRRPLRRTVFIIPC